MKKLDFMIIGAQKSATTSLYNYLKPHPEIFMSSSKEAPFFTKKELFDKGWEQFADEFFSGADPLKFWGTASPQYMGDDRAAERIHKLMPDARLIAILRNPVDRAYSHFTMQVRRELEKRSFDQAIEESLQPQALEYARKNMPEPIDGHADEDETGHYVVWGEYARVLKEFLRYFPREQLLVLYMDDLMAEPAETYKKVVDFIGIKDAGFMPSNVGKVYHHGGSERIIPDSWRQALKNNGLFRLFWDFFPENLRKRIRVFYDHNNLKKNSGKTGPSTYAAQLLVDHYATDISFLQSVTGKPVPWVELYDDTTANNENFINREIRTQS